MYAKAGELGLPAMFVDLRHEATHGEMPTLSVLRDADAKALGWLWEHYWKDLGFHGVSTIDPGSSQSVGLWEAGSFENPGSENEDTASGDNDLSIEPWGPSECSGRSRGIGML